jgi:hypothetical protein
MVLLLFVVLEPLAKPRLQRQRLTLLNRHSKPARFLCIHQKNTKFIKF